MPLEGTVSASFGILLPADKINGSDAIVVELVRPGEQPEAILEGPPWAGRAV